MKILIIQIGNTIEKYFKSHPEMIWLLLLTSICLLMWVISPYIRSFFKSDGREKKNKLKIFYLKAIPILILIGVFVIITVILSWMSSN